MRYARMLLVLVGLVALGLVALSALDGEAGVWSPRGLSEAGQPAPMATPVAVWKDCQEIARCSGCQPVYKCRSCTYQRTCARGLCSWGDVCVWGPYVKVLPRGARFLRR
ncbi:MAG TPA: hypothetical protein VMW57_02145 [Methyloceanibacter sp.]|nr:hypothetical protein [Methyloceanibacter sp.]